MVALLKQTGFADSFAGLGFLTMMGLLTFYIGLYAAFDALVALVQ